MKKILTYMVISLMTLGLVGTIGVTTASANADNDTQKLVPDDKKNETKDSSSESSKDTSESSSSSTSESSTSESTSETSSTESQSTSEPDVKEELPQTGDNTALIGGIILSMSSIGLIGVLLSKRLS